ncbi:type I phosphomannose isomerase catalytic subunit [Thalassoglobus polymorphus]|uniref:Putative mannose-6-phosphate isomerase GmuF n=1 Tax=Thalassoglobus polymorphus TaxID=2527994 RepID=A0A517QUN1_9PLAN|nr:type I phosphomannose isomerase catalytic subunit [Thalassoglobus polymorphus]QDT35335.1 putative mannose-6-phosphate isomerase GmuF [Thalassoglobus polymorphus]
MEPLQFHPIFKRYLWGGRRLGELLNKPIDTGDDYAESWEVADLPGDESVVASGQFAGQTIRQLLTTHREKILGIHADRVRFPLLIKFLDANRDLSIQVHPGQEMAQRYSEVTTGKAEMWVVLDAKPGSRVYAGLKRGVNKEQFSAAIKNGTVPDCMHIIDAKVGDCFFLKPGTVHSLGTGLLVAEIQQPNNITYRIDDWGRKGPDGKPRELHLELGLEATDFSTGPIAPLKPKPLGTETRSTELVNNEYFVVHQHRGEMTYEPADDQRAHVLMLLSGTASTTSTAIGSLTKGETLVLPADRDRFSLQLSPDAQLLDAFLN